MMNPNLYLILAIFAAVILAIAFNLVDMAVAALLGVSALFIFGLVGGQETVTALQTGGGALSLLFGGMVVARTLAVTGLFERIGAVYLRGTKGSGKRFILLLIALVAPVCAVLPNATTVILLAPIIVRVAQALEINIVGPMVLTAIVSNTSGLLTLVGDPATFLVGSSIGMTFNQYLRTASLGGLLTLLVLIPLIPRLMPDMWRHQRPLPAQEPAKPLERPGFALLALAVLVGMVVLFVLGDALPRPIIPPAVAIIGATLALLVIYGLKIEPVDNVLHDIDWKTLIFLGCMFVMVEAVTKSGLLQTFSLLLSEWFGRQLRLVALALIGGVSLLSSCLANVPVVGASLSMVKGYLVAVQVVPETALETQFTAWPPATIPVFVAMMFGATLGGNATLIGAAANVVAAGICARQGQPVSFVTFLRYGLPLTVCQLALGALYVLVLGYLLR